MKQSKSVKSQPTHRSDAEEYDSLSLAEFTRLLGQYKRSVYEHLSQQVALDSPLNQLSDFLYQPEPVDEL